MDTRRQRFERLIGPHLANALAFARCLSRSQADGDDLFQVSLLRAFDHLDQLRDERAFRPWLYRIVVSVHRTNARRAFWRRLVPLADHDDVGADPADEVLDGAQRVSRALATLPPEQRAAIVLFEIEGWTVEEIADMQDVSVSAVKSRLSRGRERLRQYYSPRLAGASPAALPTPGGTP